MREIKNEQLLGEVDISQVRIDAKSRDDIPQIVVARDTVSDGGP